MRSGFRSVRFEVTFGVIVRLIFAFVLMMCVRSAASAEVLKVVVDDTIQPITQEYISRAIDQAQRNNDQAVLIEINTPGGLGDFTRKNNERINTRNVPFFILFFP